MSVKHQWNDDWQGKPEVSRAEPAPRASMSTSRYTRSTLVLKPATNH